MIRTACGRRLVSTSKKRPLEIATTALSAGKPSLCTTIVWSVYRPASVCCRTVGYSLPIRNCAGDANASSSVNGAPEARRSADNVIG